MLQRVRRYLGLGARDQQPLNLPAESQPRPIEGENLLLVSDLHLGEACKEHSRIEYLKRGSDLDRHFCGFLEYHARERRDGRPWRLVLGGDLFDFLQITIVPEGASEEAQRFGLGTREDESAWKLERLMERHHRVFVYLADFIGAGNRVEVIQGNHDEELFWPKVREKLVRGLVDLYFGGEAHGGDDPVAFAERIHFNSWFYYQPGLLYAEHGHRFDEYCATPPQLCPLRPQDEEQLAEPLAALAIRYFANLERGFKTHDKEHWGIRDYVRYYRSRGRGAALDVVRRYLGLIARSISYHLEHGRFESERARGEHERRVAEIVADGVLDRPTVEALDQLGASPVTSSRFGLYTMLGLAEWTGGLAIIFAFVLTLLTSWGLVADVLVLGAAAAAAVGWSRYARGRFPTDIRRKLDQKARRISELLGVPVVAMGHCHAPARRRMAHDHRAFYVNTGSFLATERPRHGPGEPCRCTTTFVVLPHAGRYDRPRPETQRWCTVAEVPVPFDPG